MGWGIGIKKAVPSGANLLTPFLSFTTRWQHTIATNLLPAQAASDCVITERCYNLVAMEDNNIKPKELELCHKEIDRFHQALWEEEKHYTWWIYIIFGGIVAIFASSLVLPWKSLSVVLLALCGISVCNIARMVVIREYNNLSREFAKRNKLEKDLNLADQSESKSDPDLVPDLWNMGYRRCFCLLVRIKWGELSSVRKRGTLSDIRITEWFICSFLLAQVGFLFAIGLAIVAWIVYSSNCESLLRFFQ